MVRQPFTFSRITLNETKLREQTIIRIPNFHLVRKDRTIPKNNDKNNDKNKENRNIGGGVGILIRKDIKYNEIDTSDFEEEFLATLRI